MRCWIQSLAMVLLLGAPASARAQSAADHELAKKQFELGKELREKGDCRQALPLFRTSQGLDPGSGTLLNIALCEELLDKTASALQHYQEAALLVPDNKEGRLDAAKQRIDTLTLRVPRLRIDLTPGAPVGTVVKLDGVPVMPSTLGTATPIDPGDHLVTVTAPDVPDKRYFVTSVAGMSIVLSVSPNVRPAPASVAPIVVSPPPSHGMRVAGFVVGGLGVAGLGVGAVTGGMALVSHATLLSECPSRKGCSEPALAESRKGTVLSHTSTATIVAGLAVLNVGALLVLLDGRKKSAAATATVTVSATPGGAGLGLDGSF